MIHGKFPEHDGARFEAKLDSNVVDVKLFKVDLALNLGTAIRWLKLFEIVLLIVCLNLLYLT